MAVSSSASTSAPLAASRVGPATMILASMGSYQVPTSLPGSRAASTRARDGQRTTEAVPAWGRKP